MRSGLDRKIDEMSNPYTEDRYIAGPLNLNRRTKQADTAMGTQIVLKAKDFEALDLLATNEGEYISFEDLYKIAWGTSKETASISHAKASLNNLVSQVNTAGNKFMQIENNQKGSYKLITHWGNSWKNRNNTARETLNTSASSNNKTHKSTKPNIESKKRRFSYKTLLTGAGVIAVVALITLLLYLTGVISQSATEPLYIDIEEPGVPLAAPNVEN